MLVLLAGAVFQTDRTTGKALHSNLAFEPCIRTLHSNLAFEQRRQAAQASSAGKQPGSDCGMFFVPGGLFLVSVGQREHDSIGAGGACDLHSDGQS
jgi:hypothetical protein